MGTWKGRSRRLSHDRPQTAAGMRVRLLGAVPETNIIRGHLQHPASANPGSAPWRTRAFDQRLCRPLRR
jgi:hypothetical protein